MIKGIIHVTGEHDTGKTTFALECGAEPSRIWFVDADIKGRATVEQLRESSIEFGRYDDLVRLAEDKRELEFHNACMKMIDSVQLGQFDAIIWDTWTNFAKTCHPFVLANLALFKRNWSRMGSIKGAEQWQEAQRLESEILNRLQTLAPIVIVVTHIKDHYLNNAKTGKQIPACSKTLVRVPRFRIWLRHNPSGPVPIGLVLKRIDDKQVTDKGLRTISILPRKITPGPEDYSLWDTIARYYANPIGLRKPTSDETPDEYELSILDGTLTSDQKHTLELMLKAGAIRKEETIDLGHDSELIARAKALKGKKPLPAIAKELGITVAEAAKMLR